MELRFAWDNLEDFESVKKAIDLLRKNKINRCLWYILVGFNTTFKQDLLRANYLRKRNQNAFVMRYNGNTNPILTEFARWVNKHDWFHGVTWQNFLWRNHI